MRIRFVDGSSLVYEKGKFDNWCVIYYASNGINRALLDRDYFFELYELADKYDRNTIYDDFVKLYNSTTNVFNNNIKDIIEEIVKHYNCEDQLKVEKLFSVLYMTMVSEENRNNTKLGKRIKHLGIYELLCQNKSVEYATTFMIGKKWMEIDALCKERGF